MKNKQMCKKNVNTSSIVFVITSLQGSGAESFVLALGKGFYELGFDVHIVLLSQLIEFELDSNLRYHVFDYNRFKNIPIRAVKFRIMARAFDKFLKNNIPNCQLVLSNLVRSDRMTTYISYAPVAHIIHNNFSNEYQSALQRKPKKTIHQFSRLYANHPCVCVSQGVEQDFKHHFNELTTTTIYNAFDKEKVLQDAKLLEENHLPSNLSNTLRNGYLIHVGKFKYQKAHDTLLRAYALSSKKYPLVLLGQGPLFETMKTLAIELGIVDKVHFLGFQKSPYPLINQATAMILSSRYEGFGRVIAEAQILDIPVISTDCPSGPNEMLPSINLVPVDDVNALAEKMTVVMDNPMTFYIPFDDKFSANNIAEAYVDYFLLNA